MPHSTHVSLPVLGSGNDEPAPDPLAMLDSEDTVQVVPNPPVEPEMTAEEAREKGFQPTHVLPPEES